MAYWKFWAYLKMKLISDTDVRPIFEKYPEHIRPIMEKLRQMIINAADKIDGIDKLTESLKWGEPSYRSNNGSTIRMDWKSKNPDYCALYFQCTTSLVSTFRVVYGDELQFEGKRAILLNINEEIPEKVLTECLSMALSYHRIKHLPLLGA